MRLPTLPVFPQKRGTSPLLRLDRRQLRHATEADVGLVVELAAIVLKILAN
jgi:hypothetical protein